MTKPAKTKRRIEDGVPARWCYPRKDCDGARMEITMLQRRKTIAQALASRSEHSDVSIPEAEQHGRHVDSATAE